MSDDARHDAGLSKRELERELAWMLRRVPTDPAELVKFVGNLVVTLIDKNNAALARRLDRSDDDKPGAA